MQTSNNFSSLPATKWLASMVTDMVTIKEEDVRVHVEEVVPSVIEPSFGIGRIMYTILEKNFNSRKSDEQRTFLSLQPVRAPYKCSILPLSSHPDFTPFVRNLSEQLTRGGISDLRLQLIRHDLGGRQVKAEIGEGTYLRLFQKIAHKKASLEADGSP